MKKQVTKLTTVIEDNQKTLAMILRKLLNPDMVAQSGFGPGSTPECSTKQEDEGSATPLSVTRSDSITSPTS